MPSVEFEVWCSCGAGLCSQTTDVRGGVSVEPCSKCLDKATAEEYNRGYDEGYQDGKGEEVSN